MRKVGVVVGVLLLWTLGLVQGNAAAWFWESDKLATINGRDFSADDFRSWWINWKEEGMSFPETPDPFVDWHLQVQEAESMELFNEPDFRHKIDVFLKARTLLLYQGDKVANRVAITDSKLKDRYEEKYLPRLRLQLLYFNDEKLAQDAFARLTTGHEDVAEFAGKATLEKKDSLFFEEKVVRHSQLQPEWRAALDGLAEGDIAVPFSWSKGFVVLKLLGRERYDEEDFQKLKPVITSEIRSEEEARLTRELVEELQKRYRVVVDWDLLGRINLNAPDEKLLDQTLITMDNEKYPARVFLSLAGKEMQFRNQYGYEVGGEEAFKKNLINGVLAQTLTTRAALDEHYEEKEPLRPLYQFYRQHRLVRELEKRLFRPQVKVTEADIEKYYNDNLALFSQPAKVSIALVEDEENLVRLMYEEMKKGSDFFAVARKYYSGEPPVRDMEYDKLDGKVREVLDKLTQGGVSQPLLINGHHTIIKLVKKTPATPMPLDHVEDKVATLVEKEQFEQARQRYLATLKERSQVIINNSTWEKLKKELGDLHVGKEN
ncbi:MAG: peptidylprolyl isomerase [Thermodesulfobacteriota bacterium]